MSSRGISASERGIRKEWNMKEEELKVLKIKEEAIKDIGDMDTAMVLANIITVLNRNADILKELNEKVQKINGRVSFIHGSVFSQDRY